MAHHKRRRPKNRRAGCLLCKPYKANGVCLIHRMRFSDRRRLAAAECLRCEDASTQG